MVDKTIVVKHIQRNDTQANWLSTDPILSKGELGIETDTFKIKVGNGVDSYANLPYLNATTVSRIVTKKVVATTDGQSTFLIPFEDYDSESCYLDIRINSTWINPEKYTIDGKNLNFNGGRKIGTEVFFTCHYLENHPSDRISQTKRAISEMDELKSRVSKLEELLEQLVNQAKK